MADNADLRAAARVPGSGLDFDDSVVDFGHFLREQLLHEFRMRAGEENLRPRFSRRKFRMLERTRSPPRTTARGLCRSRRIHTSARPSFTPNYTTHNLFHT